MKVVVRIVVLLALVGGIGYGVWYWQFRKPVADDGHLKLFGNIDVRQVELAINGNDRIDCLAVEEGDRIKKGELLARLDTKRLELAVARAKAQIETQQQVVARLVAGSRPEEIRKVKADVAAAEAMVRDAIQRYNRYSKLVKTNAVSQQQADDAKTALDSARAKLKAAEAARDLVVAGPRKEDIAQAKATLRLMQVELAQAQHNLDEAFLYAPNDGVVQNRILEVGDMASPQKPVFTIALNNPVWARVYIPEPDLGKIHEGMPAVVLTDSFPGKKFAGWIGFISPTAEFTPKPVETEQLRTKLVYQVRVMIKNPNNELRLGMPVTVEVDTRAKASPLEATEMPAANTCERKPSSDGKSQTSTSGK